VKNYTVSSDYFTRWKNNACAVWGPLKLGALGPGPAALEGHATWTESKRNNIRSYIIGYGLPPRLRPSWAMACRRGCDPHA